MKAIKIVAIAGGSFLGGVVYTAFRLGTMPDKDFNQCMDGVYKMRYAWFKMKEGDDGND